MPLKAALAANDEAISALVKVYEERCRELCIENAGLRADLARVGRQNDEMCDEIYELRTQLRRAEEAVRELQAMNERGRDGE